MKEEFNLSEKIVREKLSDDEGMICSIKDGVMGIAETNFIHTEDVKEFIKKIEKKVMNARMYADMDEPDFWGTSTISPQEAEIRAKYYEELLMFILEKAGKELTTEDEK